MYKKIPIYAALILIALAVIITFDATYLAINSKHNRELNEILANDYVQAILSMDDVVEKNYIGKIDTDAVKASLMRGYLSGIGDKYAEYMTSDEYAEYMNQQRGNTVGIGVNVIYDAEDGSMEVVTVIPESPAEEIGLQGGDRIVAVSGQRILDIGYYAAIDLIRGEEGSTVSFTVRRGGEETEFSCKRRAVKTVSVRSHVYADDPAVGVIRITEFIGTTPEQFKASVEELLQKGCRSFVFDVRNNPGGELNSILSVLDYLLPEGPLAHIYYQSGEDSHHSSDASCLDYPMAVLINDQTASAAELFTSALRDYAKRGLCRAVLVGTTTYGKGTLQRFFTMRDGGAFKISVGRYDPPYGDNYDGVGIEPDITVELSDEAKAVNFYKLTDDLDNQLIAAVSALKAD